MEVEAEGIINFLVFIMIFFLIQGTLEFQHNSTIKDIRSIFWRNKSKPVVHQTTVAVKE